VLIGLLTFIGTSIIVIGVISGVYRDFILNSLSDNDNAVISRTNSPDSSIGGHVPGYPIGETSGTIIDPIEQVVNPQDSVVDPEKYLREFNYGRVSTLPNGKTLREFTLVASDQLVKEVSPGVSYNVWTFNGTVPGPTIRATEGDIVRINFFNNGSMPHSFHTHGIHPAEMD
jgi:manganese oxidase